MSETKQRDDTQEVTRERKLELVPVDGTAHVDIVRRFAGPTSPDKATVGGRLSWRAWLFLFLVALPVSVSLLYNGLIASDRYLSTASYIVRQTQPDSSLLGMLQSQTVSRVDDESFAVAEFMRSRDAVDELDGDGMLSAIFAADNVDMFSRFPGMWAGDTREDLYDHFQKYLHVEFQRSTGVSVLDVQSFSPEAARRIAEKLLVAAEALVNRLNDRARNDAIDLGRKMVDDALARLSGIRDRITQFRNDESMIDPSVEVKAASELIKQLLLETSKIDAKLAETIASTPDNPMIPQLRIKRDALEESIRGIRERVAGSGNASLARKISDYERLVLERELAEKQLAGAVGTMEAAVQEARSGRLYLERIVEPSHPDRPAFPRRLLNILATLGICLLLYWIVRSMADLLTEQN